MNGKLVLEDGGVFEGTVISEARGVGEVVFNTGMTGYQEVLTDPSYCGQMVTMTYPLIGNYGVTGSFNQAEKAHVRGFIISELCDSPSNWEAEGNLRRFLLDRGIPCIYGIDTRAVTRRIRSAGTMRGVIAPEDAPDEEIKALLGRPPERATVAEVTTRKVYHMAAAGPRVAVLDYGTKRNILDSLVRVGCDLTVFPADTPAAAILGGDFAGVFLSNGPGDPKDVPEAIAVVKELIGKKPIFGICLGHQLFALAMGADTYKLKFGHRGANHPVKDLATGRVHITSQNHGYAVDEASLAGKELAVTHRAVNDGTVEGMRHTSLPVFSMQYHPEAAPGPDDNTYLFDTYLELLRKGE